MNDQDKLLEADNLLQQSNIQTYSIEQDNAYESYPGGAHLTGPFRITIKLDHAHADWAKSKLEPLGYKWESETDREVTYIYNSGYGNMRERLTK